MKPNETPSPLPPKVPVNLPELDRAITLLGNRTKSELNAKPKRELEQLLGTYPSVPQAVQWKTALSKMRKERAAPTNTPNET